MMCTIDIDQFRNNTCVRNLFGVKMVIHYTVVRQNSNAINVCYKPIYFTYTGSGPGVSDNETLSAVTDRATERVLMKTGETVLYQLWSGYDITF
jgi:hypothetical protein